MPSLPGHETLAYRAARMPVRPGAASGAWLTQHGSRSTLARCRSNARSSASVSLSSVGSARAAANCRGNTSCPRARSPPPETTSSAAGAARSGRVSVVLSPLLRAGGFSPETQNSAHPRRGAGLRLSACAGMRTVVRTRQLGIGASGSRPASGNRRRLRRRLSRGTRDTHANSIVCQAGDATARPRVTRAGRWGARIGGSG